MRTASEPSVLYEEHGAVAVLPLNRPASLNRFTRQMHRDLWAALDRIEANKAIRALVLTGAGRAFCAGADLSEFVFVAGGILEVQPGSVTVLADTAIRGHDLDEAAANEARKRAEEDIRNAKNEIDLAKAQGEFAAMAAQIAAIQKLRRK